jgi:hypothetical protein
MFKLFSLLTSTIQAKIAFMVTVCIYMLLALLDSEGGIDGFVGLVFCLFIAAFLSALTIILCFIVGLPLRLNKSIYKWWTDHFYISIILTIIGLLLLFLSLTPQYIDTVTIQIDGQNKLKQIPDSIFSITGWFLTAFATLHLFPPNKLKDKIKNIIVTFS